MQKIKDRFGIPNIICFTAFIVGLFFLPFHTYADDISFEVRLDRNKAYLGQRLTLSFNFYGTRDISVPEVPEIKGFQTRYLGPSTMVSIVNGKASKSITHNYNCIPLETGTFNIGPFEIVYKGKTYISKPIIVEVTSSIDSFDNQAPKAGKVEQKLEDRVFVRMQVTKKRVYLNEIIYLTTKLYVSNLSVRDVQYPKFKHDGFSFGEFSQPRQYKETLNGILYNVIEFKNEVFCTRTGEVVLAPAEIYCNFVIRARAGRKGFSVFNDDFFNDFFGRNEIHPLNLKSAEIPMVVIPLPQEGRPDDFKGAIGKFNFNFSSNPREVKVGDPITLRMQITGKGNFSTVTLPEIKAGDEFKVYDAQVNVEPGRKTFEQAIILKAENIDKIPAINFSYFDPDKEKYETVVRGPVTVKVIKLDENDVLRIVEFPQGLKTFKNEKLGRDIVYIKEVMGKIWHKDSYLHKNKVFLWFQIIPAMIILSFIPIHKKKEKLKTDKRYARRLYAPKKAKKGIRSAQGYLSGGKTDKFYYIMFKTLQEYLGDKFHLAKGGVIQDVIADVFSSKKIDRDVAGKVRNIFKDCDMVRFASSEFKKEQMEDILEDLKYVIDYFERFRG